MDFIENFDDLNRIEALNAGAVRGDRDTCPIAGKGDKSMVLMAIGRVMISGVMIFTKCGTDKKSGGFFNAPL